MYATATTRSAPVFGLRREIDRLFEDTFGRGQAGRNEWTPAVDIYETDAELTFVFDVPGIQPEEVEVSAADGVLTIQGESVDSRANDEDGRYHLLERNYGSFMRRFQLPQGVDSDKILADVEHGVLRVHIPKTALPKPKKIQIAAGAEAGRRAQRAIGRGESRQDSPATVAGARQSK